MVHTTEHAAEAAPEAAAAEELSKEVLRGHTAATGTTLKTGLAILVVDLTLLRVGEDLIGVGDLLELFFRSGVVCVLVWRRVSALSLNDKYVQILPGWYLRAFCLYAFFNSCSVAEGEIWWGC